MKKLRFAMILLLCLGVFLCLGAVAYGFDFMPAA